MHAPGRVHAMQPPVQPGCPLAAPFLATLLSTLLALALVVSLAPSVPAQSAPIVDPASLELTPIFLHPGDPPATLTLLGETTPQRSLHELRLTAPAGLPIECPSTGTDRVCQADEQAATGQHEIRVTFTPPVQGAFQVHVPTGDPAAPFNATSPDQHDRVDEWALRLTSPPVDEAPSGTNPLGQRVQQATLETTVDLEPPTTTVEILDDGSAYSQANRTVELNATDPGAGPAWLYVTTDGTDPTRSNNTNRTIHPADEGPILVNLTEEGEHVVTWAAEDRLGNLAAPANRTITIDRTPPRLTVTDPAPGQVQPTRSAEVGFAVTDALAGPAQLELDCRLEPGSWAPCQSSQDHTFELTADGTATVHLRATDPAGNQVEESLLVHVDTARPELALGTLGPTHPTDSVRLNVTVEDLHLDHPGFELACRLAGASWGACDTSTYHWFRSLPDGDHVLEVRATDPAGHTTTATRALTVDTQPPELTLFAPVDGAAVKPGTQATFDIQDPDPGAGIEEVACQLDDQPPEPCTSHGHHPLTDLEPGVHTLTLLAQDRAGHITQASTTFTIDDVGPTVEILDPAPGGHVSPNASTMRFHVDDPTTPTEEITLICWADDEVPVPCESTISHAFELTDAGAHSFHVRATDPAGHTNTTSIPVHLDIGLPTVRIEPSEAPWRATEPNQITAHAEDPDGLASITWSSSGRTLTTDDAQGSSTFNSTLTHLFRHSGMYTIAVTVVDAAGNTVTEEAQVEVDVPPERIERVGSGSSGSDDREQAGTSLQDDATETSTSTDVDAQQDAETEDAAEDEDGDEAAPGEDELPIAPVPDHLVADASEQPGEGADGTDVAGIDGTDDDALVPGGSKDLEEEAEPLLQAGADDAGSGQPASMLQGVGWGAWLFIVLGIGVSLGAVAVAWQARSVTRARG